MSLTPVVGPSAVPFIFFFPAVAAAAWFGRRLSGVITLVGSTVLASYSFLGPINSFGPLSEADYAAIAAFILAGSIIVISIDAMHEGRRKAEGSGGLLRTTLASIGDAVIVTDNGGAITFLNREAERLTGWDDKGARGKPLESVFRIINEDSRKLVENPVEKVFRTGTTVGLANHTLLISKSGVETPIDDSAAPVRDSVTSDILGVVLVFRDVTDQRRAQRVHQQLAMIVEYSRDAIFTKSLDGTIRTWNKSAERLFGYTPEEIIGKSITTLIPAERLEEEPRIIASLRAGEPIDRMETVRVAKDGRKIDVSISVSPLKNDDGEIIGASKIVHDITEIRNARLALERQSELLQTTLASIGDAVIVTDPQGRATFLNKEAERMTGWKQSEITGRALPEVFHIIHEETREPAENPVDKVIRIGSVVGLANHTLLIAKDGTETPIDDSAAPIRLGDGPLLGVVLVFRDITERKAAEDALREADRRKDQFLAILAHELRNPLSPIRLSVSMLKRLSPADKQIQDCNDIIDRQARQLERLLDDLLDITRVSSGKIVLRKARVSLAAAVANAVEASRPLIESQGHTLLVDVPTHSLELEADLARLSQVIANLLNNAAKYTPRGGRINLIVEQDGDSAVIRVRDNGIGIRKDQLGHIFDLFTQVDQSLERSQGGLGVGLSLARSLVELHGGRIEAKSEGLGQGSEFTVRLPALKSDAVNPAEPVSEQSERRTTPRRILIADDNVDSAMLFSAILRREGHEVVTVHDGAAAIAAANELKPEMAFLDIGMPKLNGYDVAKVLRAEFEMRITLIAVTGWGQEHDKKLAHEAGFDHHLTKPVDFQTVEQLIASA